MKSLKCKIFTRIPQTGYDMLVGEYTDENGNNQNIYSIINNYPRGKSVFLKILDYCNLLEKDNMWPQELDFLIEEDRVSLFNSKDLEMCPTAKMQIINEFMVKEKMRKQDISKHISVREVLELETIYQNHLPELLLVQKIKKCI